MSRQHPVPAAVAFLAAQPGQPDLALRIHHPGPDGRCGGCFGETRQKWPCLIAGLALEVRARQQRNRARKRLSTPVVPPEVLGVHGWRADPAGPHSGPQDPGMGGTS